MDVCYVYKIAHRNKSNANGHCDLTHPLIIIYYSDATHSLIIIFYCDVTHVLLLIFYSDATHSLIIIYYCDVTHPLPLGFCPDSPQQKSTRPCCHSNNAIACESVGAMC